MKRSGALLIVVAFFGSACQGNHRRIGDRGQESPYAGLSEVAIIDSPQMLRTAELLSDVLDKRGITPVIEGSTVYSVMVPNHQAEQALKLLRDSEGLLGHGVVLVTQDRGVNRGSK
jgi:hypothetical protein